MSVNKMLENAFPLISDEEWKNLVIKDLKGKDFEATLVSEDANGIKHQPYYRKSAIQKSSEVKALLAAQRKTKNWELLAEQIKGQDPVGDAIRNKKIDSLQLNPDENYVVDASNYLHAGANELNQLSLALHHSLIYLDLLTELGLKPEEASKKLSIKVGLGNEYFLEIAKLRALRYLTRKLFEAYGVECEIIIHAESTSYALAHLDAHNNLIRSTSQAMSAIIGGCNTLYLASFDSLGDESDFGKRLALNIQRILNEEAHFAKVIDPASGSYYIDYLSTELAQKAWDQFLDWEKRGFSTLVVSGEIEAILSDNQKAKIAAYQSNEKIMLGVNRFQNPDGVNLQVQSDKPSLSKTISS